MHNLWVCPVYLQLLCFCCCFWKWNAKLLQSCTSHWRQQQESLFVYLYFTFVSSMPISGVLLLWKCGCHNTSNTCGCNTPGLRYCQPVFFFLFHHALYGSNIQGHDRSCIAKQCRLWSRNKLKIWGLFTFAHSSYILPHSSSKLVYLCEQHCRNCIRFPKPIS